MVMRFKSEEDYRQFLRLRELEWRRAPRQALPDADETPDPGPESVLAGKIGTWARDNGYPMLAFRQSRKAKGFLVAGWPDIEIKLPNGRSVSLELKSATGRMKQEQKDMKLRFMALGHEIYTVKSWKRFLEIVGNASRI